MSEITKGFKTKYIVLFCLSLALNVIPMLVFFFIGFSQVDTTKKVVLSFTAVSALVLGIIMLISKMHIKRSIFWVIFFVMYMCMNDLYYLILIMGICTILDEIIVSPMYKAYGSKFRTNKEIDKRLT